MYKMTAVPKVRRHGSSCFEGGVNRADSTEEIGMYVPSRTGRTAGSPGQVCALTSKRMDEMGEKGVM